MRLIIVEDDYLQAGWIYESLHQSFPEATLDQISTESEFRLRFEELVNQRPDAIVMDVMLRWADPSPDLVLPPNDVEREGFYRAGLRCERILAENEKTADIPVILYTVLERTDLNHELPNLPRHVQYVAKESDLNPLIEKLRELIPQPPRT